MHGIKFQKRQLTRSTYKGQRGNLQDKVDLQGSARQLTRQGRLTRVKMRQVGCTEQNHNWKG
jgi:hypothetical protein